MGSSRQPFGLGSIGGAAVKLSMVGVDMAAKAHDTNYHLQCLPGCKVCAEVRVMDIEEDLDKWHPGWRKQPIPRRW